MLLQYSIIVGVLLIIAFAIVKANKKDITIEMNKFVNYLGGKDNIINMEINKSRCKVDLKKMDLVNKEMIQKLGAKGIVEIENQLKIILGGDCRALKKCINDYILDHKKIEAKKK